MKQEVWFDIDDVLVDTSEQIHRVLLARTGLDIPVSDWTSHLFSKMYGLGQDRVEEMRGWWREDGVIEKARAFEGAFNALHQVAQKGHRVGLITARAWHPNARALTEDMINQHNLPVSEVVLLAFGESKRDLLASRASRISAYIDDTHRHVSEMEEAGVPSALVRRPWNREIEDHGGVIEHAHIFPGWMSERNLLGWRPRPSMR